MHAKSSQVHRCSGQCWRSSSFAQNAAQDADNQNADKSAARPVRADMQGMQGMNMGEAALSSMPSFHASSGTAWQPASVPETMWMISPGGWELMLHYTVFITYNQQGGPRGEGKAESTNYFMFMEQHRLGRAHFFSGRCFRRSR